MKYLFIFVVLIISTLAMAQFTMPRVNNDNNVQYGDPGWYYEVKQENLGICAYRETALGADTLFMGLDIDSASWDHFDLWIEWTADAANGNYAATKTTRNVAIYMLPTLTYTARTITAGHKISISNMNNGGSVLDYVYRTLTPDSASYANKALIANISGRTGESTGLMGPFWLDANAATDSTITGFLMITADTVGVDWKLWLVPRE